MNNNTRRKLLLCLSALVLCGCHCNKNKNKEKHYRLASELYERAGSDSKDKTIYHYDNKGRIEKVEYVTVLNGEESLNRFDEYTYYDDKNDYEYTTYQSFLGDNSFLEKFYYYVNADKITTGYDIYRNVNNVTYITNKNRDTFDSQNRIIKHVTELLDYSKLPSISYYESYIEEYSYVTNCKNISEFVTKDYLSDGSLDQVGRYVYTYDSNNNLISETAYYDPTGTNERLDELCLYEREGNKTTVSTYEISNNDINDKELTEKEEYTYVDGKVVKYLDYDVTDNVSELYKTIEYTYDHNDLTIEKEYYFDSELNESYLYSTTTYSYEEIK